MLHGQDFDAAKEKCHRLEKLHGLTNIAPFDDPYVIAGQGTVGLRAVTPNIVTKIRSHFLLRRRWWAHSRMPSTGGSRCLQFHKPMLTLPSLGRMTPLLHWRRPAIRSVRSRTCRARRYPRYLGRSRVQRDLASSPSDLRPGSLPGAESDRRQACVHEDQRPIPNRGLDMPNINMHGVTYMQQINEAGNPAAGLHIEPGIWALVPQTSNPAEPQTVVRMASIPHGTVINAQGIFQVVAGGPQNIPDNNILPFFFNTPAPSNAQFDQVALTFSELDLSIPTQFRQKPAGISQADLQKIVKNPNSVLQDALHASLQGTSMTSRTFLHISTTNSIIKGGGGTANTAFLTASTDPQVGNARATQVQATFWIETIAGTGGQPDKLQLQYTQLVMLDFNGIHWPHVTVGTLVKQ